jgi:hypothetical protein
VIALRSTASPIDGNHSAIFDGRRKNISVAHVYEKSSSDIRVLTVNLS